MLQYNKKWNRKICSSVLNLIKFFLLSENNIKAPHPLTPSPKREGGTPSPLGEGWGEVL